MTLSAQCHNDSTIKILFGELLLVLLKMHR